MGRRSNFIASNDGGTAVEYALIAGLISAFLLTAVLTLGSALDEQFTGIADVAAEVSPTPS